MLGEVNGSNDQSRIGLGAIPKGVPIIKTPQVFPPVANPPTLGQGNPGVAQKRQYVEPPHYDRGFKQRVYGRNRGGGYGGRNKYKFFPRGGRGGGYTNPNSLGIANTSTRGNGGSNRGGNGSGPGFYAVWCWNCKYPNPSQNTICSQCYSRMR